MPRGMSEEPEWVYCDELKGLFVYIPDAMHERRFESVWKWREMREGKCSLRADDPQFYKRIAKPRNTLPIRAAMLMPALGTKVPAAAPVPPMLEPVA